MSKLGILKNRTDAGGKIGLSFHFILHLLILLYHKKVKLFTRGKICHVKKQKKIQVIIHSRKVKKKPNSS